MVKITHISDTVKLTQPDQSIYTARIGVRILHLDLKGIRQGGKRERPTKPGASSPERIKGTESYAMGRRQRALQGACREEGKGH